MRLSYQQQRAISATVGDKSEANAPATLLSELQGEVMRAVRVPQANGILASLHQSILTTTQVRARTITVTLKTAHEESEVDVSVTDNINDAVREHLVSTIEQLGDPDSCADTDEQAALEALGFKNQVRLKILLGGEEVTQDSFEDRGIDEDSTLSVYTETVATFKEGLLAALSSGDATTQEEATKQYRMMLSRKRNPPIQAVLNSGAMEGLVAGLYSTSATLQYESAWALTNIASGARNHTMAVVDRALPRFVELLSHPPTDEVREQAAWAIGNMAGDGPIHRDRVLSQGALQPLLGSVRFALTSDKLPMLRTLTWALSNLVRGKPQPARATAAAVSPMLRQLLQHTDKGVLQDTAWALSYVTEQYQQSVLDEEGLGSQLVGLLSPPTPDTILIPALRAVGNIIAGDEAHTQAMLDCDILPKMAAVLENPSWKIRHQALWALSNISAGCPGQIEQFIISDLVQKVVGVILGDDKYKLKVEATYVLANIAQGGNAQQKSHIVAQGYVGVAETMLAHPDVTPQMIQMVLDSLETIMIAHVGLGQCQQLRHQVEELSVHTNPTVANVASRLATALTPVVAAEDLKAVPLEIDSVMSVAVGSCTEQYMMVGSDLDAALGQVV